jgi:hypothetical protein
MGFEFDDSKKRSLIIRTFPILPPEGTPDRTAVSHEDPAKFCSLDGMKKRAKIFSTPRRST